MHSSASNPSASSSSSTNNKQSTHPQHHKSNNNNNNNKPSSNSSSLSPPRKNSKNSIKSPTSPSPLSPPTSNNRRNNTEAHAHAHLQAHMHVAPLTLPTSPQSSFQSPTSPQSSFQSPKSPQSSFQSPTQQQQQQQHNGGPSIFSQIKTSSLLTSYLSDTHIFTEVLSLIDTHIYNRQLQQSSGGGGNNERSRGVDGDDLYSENGSGVEGGDGSEGEGGLSTPTKRRKKQGFLEEFNGGGFDSNDVNNGGVNGGGGVGLNFSPPNSDANANANVGGGNTNTNMVLQLSPPRNANKLPLSPRKQNNNITSNNSNNTGNQTAAFHKLNTSSSNPRSPNSNSSSYSSGIRSPHTSPPPASMINGYSYEIMKDVNTPKHLIPQFYVKSDEVNVKGVYSAASSSSQVSDVELSPPLPATSTSPILAGNTETPTTPTQQQKHDNEVKQIDWIFSTPNTNAKGSGSNQGSSQGSKSVSPTQKVRDLSLQDFAHVTKACGFPSFFNGILFDRVCLLFDGNGVNRVLSASSNTNSNTNLNQSKTITKIQFKIYHKTHLLHQSETERFFTLIKSPSSSYIQKDDFIPPLSQLLQTHPGLTFLSNHVEFQEKYALTVITRIFYKARSRAGLITLRMLKLQPCILSAFALVDNSEDINKVTDFFSYEHFYVLYCRFWELDCDRDYKIRREDLMKYGENCLSSLVVDRVFEFGGRPFGISSSPLPSSSSSSSADTNDSNSDNQNYGKNVMTYSDFIYFMLSECDKTNVTSISYWFPILDLDMDGILNLSDMRTFYQVQTGRMRDLGHEIIGFEDMICQMVDMIKPDHSDKWIQSDFSKSECNNVSGSLFDALFNLNKYLQFESRDPFMERQKREDEFTCDWDRYACVDYNRLAVEEEMREEECEGMGMQISWGEGEDMEEDEG